MSQSDFYQLFAYGKHYLSGVAQLILVHLGTETFNAPLETFDLEDRLWLDATPLDLEPGCVMGSALPDLNAAAAGAQPRACPPNRIRAGRVAIKHWPESRAWRFT